MNKIIQGLIDNLRYIFKSDLLNKMAKKTKFLEKNSKFTPEKFVSLCVFSDKHICTDSLETLSYWLGKNENLKITKQGVNNRFNKQGESFLKSILNKLLSMQNKFLCKNEDYLKIKFNSIDVCDSTAYKVPKNLNEYYRGYDRNGCESLIKINFEYDILSGQFRGYDLSDPGTSDFGYLASLENRIEKNDLKLKDLGYFKISHLKYIDDSEAFYVSRVKSGSSIYEIRNGKYSKIDLKEYSMSLSENDTIEIPEVYLGAKEKLKTRLILTKLNEENKNRKMEIAVKNSNKKGRRLTENAVDFAEINVYVTNAPSHIIDTKMVYEIYSLRWQIEIMFKVWKSIFQIHLAKQVKIERYHCHLYGKLIALLISTTLVFRYRDEFYFENDKQLSELKAFKLIKSFLIDIRQAIWKNESSLLNFFQLIKDLIDKYGIKTRKKGHKTFLDIIEPILV